GRALRTGRVRPRLDGGVSIPADLPARRGFQGGEQVNEPARAPPPLGRRPGWPGRSRLVLSPLTAPLARHLWPGATSSPPHRPRPTAPGQPPRRGRSAPSSTSGSYAESARRTFSTPL